MERQQGITLLELLISLVVLTIAMSVAVPLFTPTLNAIRINSTADSLLQSFQLARSEAIKRQKTILLCPLASSENQPNQCHESTHWEQG